MPPLQTVCHGSGQQYPFHLVCLGSRVHEHNRGIHHRRLDKFQEIQSFYDARPRSRPCFLPPDRRAVVAAKSGPQLRREGPIDKDHIELGVLDNGGSLALVPDAFDQGGAVLQNVGWLKETKSQVIISNLPPVGLVVPRR